MSDNALALLLLCTRLPEDDENLVALRPGEWRYLITRLMHAQLVPPKQLLNLRSSELSHDLNIEKPLADRIAHLLDRVPQLYSYLIQLAQEDIGIVTYYDDDYPNQYRDKLGSKAPLIIYCAGNRNIISKPGISAIGTRELNLMDRPSSSFVGASVAGTGNVIVSGMAHGVDRIASEACLDSGGQAIGFLSDSIVKHQIDRKLNRYREQGQLLILSPFAPTQLYHPGMALSRNKFIYAYSDLALVVSCYRTTGGTWTGANEALKAGWCTVFIRESCNMPEAHRRLIKNGARGFPYPFPEGLIAFSRWLIEQNCKPQGRRLFE